MGRAITDDGTKRDFAVACGIGFDAEVIDATGAGQKLRWGKLAYIANAIGQTGTIRNVAHTITLDGVATEFEAAQVFVANFGKMLPLVEPAPSDRARRRPARRHRRTCRWTAARPPRELGGHPPEGPR